MKTITLLKIYLQNTIRKLKRRLTESKSFRILTKVFLFLLVLVLAFSGMYLVASADSEETYYLIPANTPVALTYRSATDSVSWFQADKPTRWVAIRRANSGSLQGYSYCVSDVSFNFSIITNNDLYNSPVFSTYTDTSISQIYNNITYYIQSDGKTWGQYVKNNCPYVHQNISDTSNTAYRYTYGDLSVDPVPPLPYGDLFDVSFKTSFVSENLISYINTMPYNKDTIYWNSFIDDKGNDISDDSFSVDIRVIKTYYDDSSESNLLTQTLEDLHLIESAAVILGNYTINESGQSFTWNEIKSAFSDSSYISGFFEDLFPQLYNGSYYIYGWIYQVRLVNSELNYTGNWQTVYTSSSIDPQHSQTILNEYYTNYNFDYSYQVNNSITYLNEINNTYNTYLINNNTVYTSYDYDYNNITNLSNEINYNYNSVHDIELNIIDGLNSELSNFELPDLTTYDSKFNTSNNFVKDVFNRLITASDTTTLNPVGNYLMLTLTLGFIFLIFGIIK